MSIDEKKATALRKPFPKESIGKLPKGGAMLDYVGHAAVTDRLLTVDPEWSWEPFAIGDDGLPALDASRNLWIRLTVCGVTRIGVGDGKSLKECIGDAIRNAAMRFGVALDLWAKENLVEFKQAAQAAAAAPKSTGDQPEFPPAEQAEHKPPPKKHAEPRAQTAPESPLLNPRGKLAASMFATLGEIGVKDDRDERLAYVSNVIGRDVKSSSEMTDADAKAVIDHAKASLDQPFGADLNNEPEREDA